MGNHSQKNDEELIKKVEKAAQKGAMKGSGISSISVNVIAVILILIAVLVVYAKIEGKIGSIQEAFAEFKTFEQPAEEHDVVLENDGFLGYTAADFADAIMRNEAQLKKLEVYQVSMTDAATITDTGLANWAVFTKCQLLTYTGYATYTVDLSDLKKSDISLDKDDKVVTLKIPHAVLEPINVPTDEIEFGDVTKGLLAFGDVLITPEESATVQQNAVEKMEAKLQQQNTLEKADRMAILSVWEIYQPFVKAVCREYALEVTFKD